MFITNNNNKIKTSNKYLIWMQQSHRFMVTIKQTVVPTKPHQFWIVHTSWHEQLFESKYVPVEHSFVSRQEHVQLSESHIFAPDSCKSKWYEFRTQINDSFRLFEYNENSFNLLPSIYFYLRYLCTSIHIVPYCNAEISYNRSLFSCNHICIWYALPLQRALCLGISFFHRLDIVI